MAGVVLYYICTSARRWNVRYMAAFVLSSVFLIRMAPRIVSELVPPVFGALGTLLGVVFLVEMTLLLVEKGGLDGILSEL